MANVKDKEKKRDIQISLWVSKEEKKKMKEMAEKEDRSLNNFIVNKVLGNINEQ